MECEEGTEPLSSDIIQGGDCIPGEPARMGLVSQRGVSEAIAQNDRSPLEGGKKRGGEVFGARRLVEKKLGPGVHGMIQDDRANGFCNG